MSKQTQMKLMGKGETEDVDQILTKIDTLYMQKSEM